MLGFTYNQPIPVTECAVWGLAWGSQEGGRPASHEFAFFGRGIVGLDEIEHLHTASLEGYSVSGRGPWAWSPPATLFTSRTVTSLVPVVTAQVKSNHNLNCTLTF